MVDVSRISALHLGQVESSFTFGGLTMPSLKVGEQHMKSFGPVLAVDTMHTGSDVLIGH